MERSSNKGTAMTTANRTMTATLTATSSVRLLPGQMDGAQSAEARRGGMVTDREVNSINSCFPQERISLRPRVQLSLAQAPGQQLAPGSDARVGWLAGWERAASCGQL